MTPRAPGTAYAHTWIGETTFDIMPGKTMRIVSPVGGGVGEGVNAAKTAVRSTAGVREAVGAAVGVTEGAA
jgi:hypothetical protein